jgi:C4-dicarboxylate-binding protein DctP
MQRGTRIALVLSLALLLGRGAAPAPRLLFRISTENLPEHFQTKVARRFAELLAKRAGSSLNVQLSDSGRLFRDSEVVAALGRGEVEMALPGIWQLDRYAPDAAALMLPSLLGRTPEQCRSVVDGPVGGRIGAQLESATSCIVLGRWIDLGYGQLFSLAPIRGAGDIAGKKIRVAGGRGNEERIRAMGGLPISIPFADLPSYLGKGLVDGVLTTYETVETAGLDRLGLRHVYEDKEYYPFYLPLVCRECWEALSPELRSIIRSTWEELVPEARREAERSQEEAKARLVGRGLSVLVPPGDAIEAMRERLLSQEAEIAGRIGVSQPLLSLLEAEASKWDR